MINEWDKTHLPEGMILEAMASTDHIISPEPEMRAMVPITARMSLCKSPASPLEILRAMTPKTAGRGSGRGQEYENILAVSCPGQVIGYLSQDRSAPPQK